MGELQQVQLPEGWESKEFEKCLEKVQRATKIPKKKFLDKGSYPIISQESDFINGYWNGASDVLEIEKPVVIFGDHTKIVKYVDFPFVQGADGVKVLQPINNIDARFFYYQLQSISLADLGYARHYRLLKQETIVIPPLETQKKIVAVLDKAFAAIDLAKANIEKNLQNAKELFQSKLNQIFTQKDEGWEEKLLDEVCQIKPPKKEAKELLSENDLVSFVPMKTLGIGRQYFVPNEERTLGKVSGSYTYFKDGDVLLAKITPCFENGKLGIARGLKNGIGFGSSEFIVYRTKGELLPEFLYHFLNQSSFRNTGASQMTGAVGHKRIPKCFYEKAYIPLPPKDEQEQVIKNLNALRLEAQKLEKHEQKRLLDLDELKKSILQKAFAGELTQGTNHV